MKKLNQSRKNNRQTYTDSKQMYAKENEEVMKNIDTKATKENISNDLNNLEEKKTESIGDLKVGLFGSLDINKKRKKIKNSSTKLSSEKEN